MLRIQEAGESGIPLASLGNMQLEQSINELVSSPSLDKASKLLPQARAQYEQHDGFRERTLLTIVLYYCANMDPELYHDYLREALPLVMQNYRSSDVPNRGSGELLLNFLAMALLEDEFRTWKRDLLSMEPYMAEDLDLLALTLWLETDERQGLAELQDSYINAELLSKSSRSMAFKIHCMLNHFDLASQFESDSLVLPDNSNSAESTGNDPDTSPVIERFTYLTTLSYLLHNARFSDAQAYLEYNRSELLDPAYVAVQKAVILAATGQENSQAFDTCLADIAASPFLNFSKAAAEASVYTELAGIGNAQDWNSAASALYTGNENDPYLLMELSSFTSLLSNQSMTVTDAQAEQQIFSAMQFAELALQNSRTYAEKQLSMMALCIASAAHPDAQSSVLLQEQSSGYLRKALSQSELDSDGFPLSSRVEISLITGNESVRNLREHSSAYDESIHEIIRDYISQLQGYYGENPLSLQTD